MSYYIFLLVAVIVGITIVKKVASCMIRSVFLLLLVAALVIAWFYLKN